MVTRISAVLFLLTLAGSLRADTGPIHSPSVGEPVVRTIREINLSKLQPLRTDFIFAFPHATLHDSANDIGKRMDRKGAGKIIFEQIDPKRERLIYFRWVGSWKDRITPERHNGKVVFIYRPSSDRTQDYHTRLFVIPQGEKWEMRVCGHGRRKGDGGPTENEKRCGAEKGEKGK